MNKKQIVDNYKKLMKAYYPQLSRISYSVNKEKFKAYKKQRFPKSKVTSMSMTSFRLLTQPYDAWTQTQLDEAKKVIDYLRRGKVRMTKDKTTFVYRKPLYWGGARV